jgi:hypothetical protein
MSSSPTSIPSVEAADGALRHAFATFTRLVSAAERQADAGRYRVAAACAQIAAHHGFVDHAGVFASPALERVLNRIGRVAIRRSGGRRDAREVRRVLHVLTYARPVGGDTRFVWRWISADSERQHSVVITKQGTREVPELLRDAVENARGQIHVLRPPVGDLLTHAQQLADIAAPFDVVALHLFPDDVIPVLAFADPAQSPPVVFVHHSDHTFWVGSSAADLIAQLREPLKGFLEERRALDKTRIARLPIPLGMPQRSMTHAEAKARLGYSKDEVLLLTIATPFKYEPINAPSFVAVVTSVIKRHPNARLIAIGPEERGEWARAVTATNGRVVPMGSRYDTAQFYEAADIYLDSFPFSSPTSMLEAGTYGVPLLGFCPYRDDARLLTVGAPGLTDRLLLHAARADYEACLSKLIDDREYRASVGRETKVQIERMHAVPGWMQALELVYQQALSVSRRRAIPPRQLTSHSSPLDLMVRAVVTRLSIGLGPVIDTYARDLTYADRLTLLRSLWSIDRSFSMSMLLPPAMEHLIEGRFTAPKRVLKRWWALKSVSSQSA